MSEPNEQNFVYEEKMRARTEYEANKARLNPEYRRKRRGLSICASASFAIVMGYFVWIQHPRSAGVEDYIVVALTVLASGFLIYFYTGMMESLRENTIRRRIIEYEVAHIQNDVEKDIFENSIQMSYKYLDQYYLQTREHAQRGFFATIGVAIFGALLIGIGVVAMFLNMVEPSYLTSAAGIITEFIAAVFFYLYNKTITSMSRYHNKLVLSQNVSIALKVADSLPENEQKDAKKTIICELIKDLNQHYIKTDSEEEQK